MWGGGGGGGGKKVFRLFPDRAESKLSSSTCGSQRTPFRLLFLVLRARGGGFISLCFAVLLGNDLGVLFFSKQPCLAVTILRSRGGWTLPPRSDARSTCTHAFPTPPPCSAGIFPSRRMCPQSWYQYVASLYRMKNRRGHWTCWMARGGSNGFFWRKQTERFLRAALFLIFLCRRHSTGGGAFIFFFLL